MGCHDETCVLTRAPIRAGTPVVALSVIRGPHYHDSSANGNALFFGLPYTGKYDDYGGVEALDSPAQADFALKAFGSTGLYRQHGTSSRWIACNPDTLWGVGPELQHLFYDECGVTPLDVGSYQSDASERVGAAAKKAEEACEALGAKLASVLLPDAAKEQDAALFELVAEVFGQSRAWAAWPILRRKGLFASRQHLMMHRTAYDAAVAEFGGRLVTPSEGPALSMRAYFESRLDQWLERYRSELAKLESESRSLPLPSDDLRRYVRRMLPLGRMMAPMSRPWLTTELPLEGHFWGGATAESVLEVHSKSEIVDFFVFQWARSYLRIQLNVPGCGSQNRETKLPRAIHDAVVAATPTRVDFENHAFD